MEKETTTYSWSLEHHGDLLEQTAFQFVRDNIHAYEETWARFIGHDGRGEPALLIDSNGSFLSLEDPICRKRQLFAQFHYTVLDALFSLSNLYNNFNAYSGPEDILRISETLVLFHAQMGRVIDCLERAGIKIGLSLPEMKSLYATRSVVIHGPRVPLIWNGEYLIIEPSSKEDGGWDDKESQWRDTFENRKTIPLTKYLDLKYELTKNIASEMLAKLHSAVCNYMKENGLKLSKPPVPRYGSPVGSGVGGTSRIVSIMDVSASGMTTSATSIDSIMGSSPVISPPGNNPWGSVFS